MFLLESFCSFCLVFRSNLKPYVHFAMFWFVFVSERKNQTGNGDVEVSSLRKLPSFKHSK